MGLNNKEDSLYSRVMPKVEGSMIQSVERALSLLEYIAGHPEARFSLSELTGHMGMDKSSVFRILATLIKHGLVRQEDNRKTYQLGYGIYTLAAALHDQIKLTETISPYLKQLAMLTKENAHLAVRSGLQAVFIDRERASKTISANTNIGDTEELYCTAVGKCLICDMNREALDRLFSGVDLIKYTDRTIVDLDILSNELQSTMERGYAIDDGEYEASVVCLASPVYDFEGKVVASVGISGPRERIEPQLPAFIEATRTTGKEASMLLGRSNEQGVR